MTKKLTFIDMFAGIGGFRSGMVQAGMKPAGYIEWNKFARKCYEAMYDTKGEFNASDIQKVKGTDLPNADIWSFGSPCQDISIAGKQAGLVKGKQSSMFFEVIRLIEERIKAKEGIPSYLILENVKNLLSSNRGRDFARVLIEMDKIGYDAEWSVIDTASFLPQHRERIYVVGHLRANPNCAKKVFPITGQSRRPAQTDKTEVVQPLGHIKQVGNYRKNGSFGGNPQTGRVYSVAGISPTLNTMQGGDRQPKILDKIKVLEDDARAKYVIRKLTPRECWRLQGFSDQQFDKAQKAGISNSQLYARAGNAVSVPVIKAIADKIVANQNE